jgi:hypothetical protein
MLLVLLLLALWLLALWLEQALEQALLSLLVPELELLLVG